MTEENNGLPEGLRIKKLKMKMRLGILLMVIPIAALFVLLAIRFADSNNRIMYWLSQTYATAPNPCVPGVTDCFSPQEILYVKIGTVFSNCLLFVMMSIVILAPIGSLLVVRARRGLKSILPSVDSANSPPLAPKA